jgi:uncharacterized membrane protein YkvA (DUF1232 family)
MSRSRRAAAYTAAAAAAANDGPVGFVARIGAIPRLVRDVVLGRWDGLTRGRLALMGLALLYIVSPIDLLPEALLTIPGLADDAVVGAWLVAALLRSTSDYRDWESGLVSPPSGGSGTSHVVPGEVITG